MLQPLNHEQVVQLRDLIHQYFSLDEFRSFCFDLGVRYDDLPGEGLRARVTELVSLCERTGRIDHVLARCVKLKPRINWLGLNQTIAQEIKSTQITTPIQNPRQIFISYAHQDADFAYRLADDLRLRSWDIWIAPDSIHPGEKWVEAINRGLAESRLFLLILTPYAVNSEWVRTEINIAIELEHEKVIRFIPLEVDSSLSIPPILRAYQRIPFQNNYKDGLERLMQELQPEQMAQLAGWYRQLQQAMGRNDWALVQSLGAQITANYPDYRETEERVALARREAEREQVNRAEADRLYSNLKVAVDNADWTNALAQAEQIDQLVPNYQDVAQLRERARRGQRQQQNQQRQNQPGKLWAQLRRLPTWVVGGVIVVILVLSLVVLLPQLIDTNVDHTPTITQTLTRSVVANNPSELIDTLPSNPQMGDRWTRPTDGMVMVFVPGGTFAMGSDPAVDEDAQSDEQPQHDVTLTGFWIDRTEVTNSMYESCVADGACAVSDYADDSDYNGSDYPVVGVSWNDVNDYCEWAGGQLPTEAQWEYAARGDDGRLYPWGNESPTCSLAQFSSCDGNTVPVGSFSSEGDSWVDAADMAGNVWEWVADWYSSSYYAVSPAENPTGPVFGDYKVLRGGSWGDVSLYLRVASRLNDNPADRSGNVGFRCVVPQGN